MALLKAELKAIWTVATMVAKLADLTERHLVDQRAGKWVDQRAGK